MTRKRRTRRRSFDPTLFIVTALAAALVAAWTLTRQQIHSPTLRPKLSMAEARALNASIPFIVSRRQAAAPFHFRGTPAAREQAVQCLATAALYEAGSDVDGQKAVIQVVLNRLRATGYPDTVCGVVYQGSALPTGCQFSFACDGSQVRRPEYQGWEGARAEAKRALAGAVFRPVGRATHYHADWTVPSWAGSLDKIAQVGTHLFYRPKAPSGGLPVAG